MISKVVKDKLAENKGYAFSVDNVKSWGHGHTCKESLLFFSYFEDPKAKKLSIFAHKDVINRAIEIWWQAEFSKKLKLNIEYDELDVGTITIDYSGIFACHAWLDIFYTCIKIASMFCLKKIDGKKDFLDGIKLLEQENDDWKDAFCTYSKILEASNDSIGTIDLKDESGILHAFENYNYNLTKKLVRRQILNNK
jgi:hypothetical protein